MAGREAGHFLSRGTPRWCAMSVRVSRAKAHRHDLLEIKPSAEPLG
jgi:hypothetical protein